MVKKNGIICASCLLLSVMCMAGCGGAVQDGTADSAAENDVTIDSVETAIDSVETNDTETGVYTDQAVDADTGADTDADKDTEADDVNAEQPLSLSILGDSISTYTGWIPEDCSIFYPESGEVTDVSQTWWMQVLEQTGMELCVNGSSAGCTCVGDSLSLDDPLNGCSEYRISQLVGSQGRMPDVIIVYMGTNDLLKGIPLGDNDGTRCVEPGVVEDFSDAYTLILDELESNYPGAQIYCCTLLPAGDWGTEPSQPFVTFVNDLDLTSEDYSARIRVIADNRGIPVIELADCGISIDNLHEYVTDGVHPKPAGMELVAKAVLDALE